MGAILNEGVFDITINKKLKYRATHLKSRQRTCGRKSDIKTDKNILIAFHGCSFTYGVGVNDSETYPYILQQKFPSLTIENHGVPGYGQVQALLELEQALNSDKKPNVVIVNYLSFHDERNALNTAYEQKIRDSYFKSLETFPEIAKIDYAFPFGSVQNDSLITEFRSIHDITSTLPLIGYSAIMNTLQTVTDQIRVNSKEDQKITFAFIDRIHSLCKTANIKLMISYMSNDDATNKLIAHCKAASIPVIDLFIDLTQQTYTNAPYDSHPNARAHQEYAEKLLPYLQNIKSSVDK